MQYRELGKTGLKISEIGFGAWGIGGTQGGSIAYGVTDDRESKRALELAYDSGVTFYDTSDFYGFGHSELLIGEVFESKRDQVVIATKVGFLSKQGGQDFSPAYLRSSIEQSLNRLRCDYVDLYQLHSPSVDYLMRHSEILDTLHDFVQEGKTRAIGLATRSPEEVFVAVREMGLEAIQVNFNLTDQRARENGLFDFCERQNVGVIVRTPLCFGFLTGTYSPEKDYDPNDHRGSWSLEQRKKWHEATKLFSDILVNENGQTKTQLALRFCLSHPAVSTVIPGMLTREQVVENARASDLGWLSQGEIKRAGKIYRENTFFVEGNKC